MKSMSGEYNCPRCMAAIALIERGRMQAAAPARTANQRKFHMPRIYDSPASEALHLKAIQSLATETGHEFSIVRTVYEAELARLQPTARVTEFVVLLSSRHAREALRRQEESARSEPVTA